MKIESSARCPYCKIDLGTPLEVTIQDKREYTVYACNDCKEKWLRPHNPK